MANKRSRPTAATPSALAIGPGQVWRANNSGASVGVVGRDLFQPGRWIVMVHGTAVVTTLGDDDIRGHYTPGA